MNMPAWGLLEVPQQLLVAGGSSLPAVIIMLYMEVRVPRSAGGAISACTDFAGVGATVPSVTQTGEGAWYIGTTLLRSPMDVPVTSRPKRKVWAHLFQAGSDWSRTWPCAHVQLSGFHGCTAGLKQAASADPDQFRSLGSWLHRKL